MSLKAAITLEDLSKKFGMVEAISGVSLTISKNEVVALLGPNGAGKTTMMRLITGFLKPNSGKIIKTTNQLGYLPENNPIYGYLTVVEYLDLVANLKELEYSESRQQIKNVVLECGLKEVLTKKIETLSRGYRQRVGLASTLLGNPDLLILDEPTAGLDPNQVVEIRSLIKKLGKKMTIILSTHILGEVAAMCDKLFIINKGKIVYDGRVKSIKNLEKKFIELTKN